MSLISRTFKTACYLCAIALPLTATAQDRIDYDVSFSYTSQWEDGYVGVINLTNTGDRPLEDWELSFDGRFTIVNDWNGELSSVEDHGIVNTYRYNGEHFNETLLPGETASIGFTGTWEDTLMDPFNIRVNDQRFSEVQMRAFYPVWEAHAFKSPKDFPMDKLDMITHCFAFVGDNGIVNDTQAYINPELPMLGDSIQGLLNLYKEIKVENPHIQTSISVVAYQHNDIGFKAASATAESRELFANSVIDMMKKYEFDGVNIDWEFPDADDRENCLLLFEEMRKQLDQLGYEDNCYYELAICGPVDGYHLGLVDWEALLEYVDVVTFMGYNYFGPWGQYTGPNAPLYNFVTPEMGLDPESAEYLSTLNYDWSINYLIQHGVPAYKLIMAMPLYSQVWSNVADNGMGGNFTLGTGEDQIGYAQAVELYKSGEYTRYYDDLSKTAWIYNPNVDGGHYITFDDGEVLAAKSEYILEKGLLGADFWHGCSDAEGEDSGISAVHSVLKK